MGRGFALEDDHWRDWTLPDGTPCQMPAWALPERQEGHWVLRSAVRPHHLPQCPTGAIYFEQCHWPFLEKDDLDRLPEALSENMWGGIASPPGPLVAGPDDQRLLADGREGSANGPTARSSDCLAATCWKSASSSTAWTIS